MSYNEILQELRKDKGLSQTQLAEMTGIHPVTIRKYEINKLQPKKEQIKRIAASLMVSPLVFEELDANMISLQTVGDLLGLMFFMYKSQIIQVSHDAAEIRFTPVLKDHLVFIATKKNPMIVGFFFVVDKWLKREYYN